jgi:hypothetical protein
MAAELQVFGFVHDAHTAGAQTADDPVVTENRFRQGLIHLNTMQPGKILAQHNFENGQIFQVRERQNGGGVAPQATTAPRANTSICTDGIQHLTGVRGQSAQQIAFEETG